MRITDTDIVAIKSVPSAATSNLDRPQQIQFSVSAASANRSSASAIIDSCSSFENVSTRPLRLRDRFQRHDKKSEALSLCTG